MSEVDWGLATARNSNSYDALDTLKSIGDMALQKIQGQAAQANTAAVQQKTQADQFALGQDQQQAAARPGIAAMAGAGNYAGAAQQALATGDTNAFAGVRNLHSDDLDKMGREASAMGDAAYTLQSIKDPAQRQQAFAAMAPQLKQAGFGDHELASVDLSDTGLTGYLNHAIGAKTAIENEQKTRELGQGDQRIALAGQAQRLDEQRFGLEGQKFEFEKHKPEAFAMGTVGVDPSTHQVVFGGDAGGSAPTDPAGIAAQIAHVEGTGKNPKSSASGYGQMIDGTFVNTFRKTFPDQAGLTDSQILARRGTGVEAQMVNTLVQQNMGALSKAGVTPNAANTYVMHFLGPGDGLRVLKADPSTPVSALVSKGVTGANPFLRTMTVGDLQQWAAGKMGGGSTGGTGGGAGGLDAATLDRLATDFNRTHKVPPGFVKNPVAMAALQNRAAQQLAQQGGNASTSLADTAAMHADAGGLATLQKRTTVMNASETAAQSNARLVLQLAPAVGNGNIPVFNAWKNSAGRNTGDANVSKLNAAVETFANEYATVMGKGTPTDGLRAHAHDMINTQQSPAQLRGVVATLMQDMANQRAGFARERQDTLARMGGQPGGTRQAPAGATRTATGPNGAKVALVGGKWVQY